MAQGVRHSMKERPILFSGAMVRAILAGRKTQTRRTITRLRGFSVKAVGPSNTPGYDWTFRCQRGLWQDMRHEDVIARCPYGMIGDRLWVRETWAPMQSHRPIANPERYDNVSAWYKADHNRPLWAGNKWTPSIHMPRWASRVTLEITRLRLERLDDITTDDAKAEGVECRDQFAKLWQSINGEQSWIDNPFVWVVEFRHVTGVAGQ